jgi:hypothetical protein
MAGSLAPFFGCVWVHSASPASTYVACGSSCASRGRIARCSWVAVSCGVLHIPKTGTPASRPERRQRSRVGLSSYYRPLTSRHLSREYEVDGAVSRQTSLQMVANRLADEKIAAGSVFLVQRGVPFGSQYVPVEPTNAWFPSIAM